MSVYFQFNIGQYIPPVQGRTKNMKIFVYVTLPLNPLPREGDLLSLRSDLECVFDVFDSTCEFLLADEGDDVGDAKSA